MASVDSDTPFELVEVGAELKKDLIESWIADEETTTDQLEWASDGDVERSTGKCPFHRFGCKTSVGSDLATHVNQCIYGMLVSCRSSLCIGKPSAVYSTPLDLMEHAEREHGAALTKVNVNATAKLSLTLKFLHPDDALYSMKIIKNYRLKLDSDDIVIGVYFIVKEKREGDGFDQTGAVVTVAAIQLQPRKPTNYMFLLGLRLAGANGEPIKPLQFSYPETGTQPASSGSSVLPLNIAVFNSPEEFFRNWKCWDREIRLAEFSRDLVVHSGTPGFGNGNLVFLTMTTNFRAFRMSVNNPRYSNLKQWACCWNDVKVPPEIQENMLDGKEPFPSPISAFVIPQVLAKTNIMLESSLFFPAFNALLAGILTIIERIRKLRKPTQCKAIAIFKSEATLVTSYDSWRNMADAHGVQVFILKDEEVDEDVLNHFKLHGCDILLVTLSTLVDLFERYDKTLSTILTGSLTHIVLIHPSRLTCSRSEKEFQVLKDHLGSNVKSITISTIDHFLTKSCKEKIKSYFSMDDAACINVRIGPTPDYLIEKMMITGVKINNAGEKHYATYFLIENQCSDIKRWTVFFNETEKDEIDSLKRFLLKHVEPKRIAVVYSDSNTLQNPNLLTPFATDYGSIAISSYSAIDFILETEGVIMFSKPQPNDIVRLSIQYASNSLKLAYLFLDKAGIII